MKLFKISSGQNLALTQATSSSTTEPEAKHRPRLSTKQKNRRYSTGFSPGIRSRRNSRGRLSRADQRHFQNGSMSGVSQKQTIDPEFVANGKKEGRPRRYSIASEKFDILNAENGGTIEPHISGENEAQSPTTRNCSGFMKRILCRGTGSSSNKISPMPHSAYNTSNGTIEKREKDCNDKPLLPPPKAEDEGKLLLVLDLDETLVYGTFNDSDCDDDEAEICVPVRVDGVIYTINVKKRPYCSQLLQRLQEKYEICVFTAGVVSYANVVIDKIDEKNSIRHKLFRDACTLHEGKLVKDLSRLGRDLGRTIIVDNRSSAFAFHPENGIKCTSFYGETADEELHKLTDFLLLADTNTNDIRPWIKQWTGFTERNQVRG